MWIEMFVWVRCRQIQASSTLKHFNNPVVAAISKGTMRREEKFSNVQRCNMDTNNDVLLVVYTSAKDYLITCARTSATPDRRGVSGVISCSEHFAEK